MGCVTTFSPFVMEGVVVRFDQLRLGIVEPSANWRPKFVAQTGHASWTFVPALAIRNDGGRLTATVPVTYSVGSALAFAPETSRGTGTSANATALLPTLPAA